MTIFASRDFLAGVVNGVIGLLLVERAFAYGIGSLRSIGPGFFPLILGILLLIIGSMLVIQGVRTRIAVEPIMLRPLIIIPLALVAFALLLPRVGYGPAGAAVVMLSGLADSDVRLRNLILLTAVVTPLIWLIFASGFGVNLPFVQWRF